MSYQKHIDSNSTVMCFCMIAAVPPRFVNKMKNAVFVPDEDAQFTCVIQSAPIPKIRYTYLMCNC